MDIITAQVKGALENAVFNKVLALNTGISDATLRAVVSRVAEESAVFVSSQVNTTANQQVNTIPVNLIGSKNPVNLVTGNLGSQGVANNLTNILNTQLNLTIAQKITTSLEKEIKNVLPASQSGIINYSALSTVLSETLSTDINQSIGTVLNSFTSGLFGRGTTIPTTIPSVESLFSLFGGTGGLEKADEYYSSAITNKYLEQSRTFDVNYQDNQEKLTVTKQGFTDPTANYPTKEYSGRSETNKLAQGDVKGTIVQKKNKERMLGAKLPGGEAWDQPESPYKGVYPYNKVTQTESGHIIEIDDTPGSERLHIYHRSGTFVEIDANGSIVKRTVGSSYEIIDRNGKIAIVGSADISVNGECNIFVGNNANIEVEGDTNLTCHNDITAQAGGKLNLSAVEELNITSANVNVEAYHTMNFKSNVALNLFAVNDINVKSEDNLFVEAITHYIKTTDTYHQTEASLYEKHGGSRYSQAVGKVSFKSTGNFAADGALVKLNSGNSEDSKDSEPATEAGISNIGILSGRKDPTDNSQKDPVSLTIAAEYALKLEEEPQTNEEYLAQKDLILTSGFATAEEFDQAPVESETKNVTSLQTLIVSGTESLKKVKELPGNYNLSPNFTLEMLSTKAVITRDELQNTNDLKYGEVVFNLQEIALNILEPAYNLYPNLQVASGFRKVSNSSQSSLHPRGKAVDIIFKGYDAEKAYEAAIQLAKNLNYDQLILEYCNYFKTPWIHISYQGSSNRKEVLTFWNNKKYSSGLVLLI